MTFSEREFMRCEYPLRKADGTWAQVVISSTFTKADLPRLFWGLSCMAMDFDPNVGETPVSMLRDALNVLESGGRAKAGEGD